MRKIISTLLALCLTFSLVAGFTVSATAAENEDKRVLPRAETAPTMDGLRDDIYDKGFHETLNIKTAGLAISEDEDFDTGEPKPKYEPASAEIYALWYSNLPDDAEITRISQTMNDTLGGIYIFADVTDCTRAWAVNNQTVIQNVWLEDQNAYEYANATPEFELSDSFWVFLDPLNYKSSRMQGLSQFAFTSYCGFASGNGEVAAPVPSWREYYYWGIDSGNVSGESGAGGIVGETLGVKVKSTVDYVFDEKYPIPDPLPEGASKTQQNKYKMALLRAYKNANIAGYTLEMFLPWKATQMEIKGISNLPPFLIPKVGTEFGMGLMLRDNWFSYWETNPMGTKPSYEEVQNYIYANCCMLDYGKDVIDDWADCSQPEYFPTYVLGDYAKDPVDFVCGDANGDGVVDITDAMIIFYHVAKKEFMTDEQASHCDTNDDGAIDITDAMAVFYFVAKKSDSVKG